METKRQRVHAYLEQHPEAKPPEVARSLNLTRSHAYVLCEETRAGVPASGRVRVEKPKNESRTALIKDTLDNNPTMSAAEIAAQCGISRQAVYQTCRRYGWSLPTPTIAPKIRPTQRKNRVIERGGQHIFLNKYGYERRLAPSWSGAIAEMVVAVDLAKRGLHVYHSIARTGPFDLAVYDGNSILRVEVKSVSGPSGIPSNIKLDLFDILALVSADGSIRYLPDPFETVTES